MPSPAPAQRETAADFDDSAWPAVQRLDGQQLQERQSAILRSTLNLTADECRQATLTVPLCSTGRGAVIHSARASPYTSFAEYR